MNWLRDIIQRINTLFYWLNKIFLDNLFLFLIIYLISIYYLYEQSLYNLYLRSIIFCIVYLLYKLFHSYCITNANKIKFFFINNPKLNKIGIFLYKWSHIYFYWLCINNFLFNQLKKLRYILLLKYDLKLLKKIMDIIDTCFYFCFYLIIESFFECYVNIYYKFKEKLFNYTYKNFFFWRIIILSFSIFISFYLINFLFDIDSSERIKLSFGYYLLRILIISNFIIFIRSLWVYKKNFYLINNKIFSKNRFLLVEHIHCSGLFEITILEKIYKSRYFLTNVNFYERNHKGLFIYKQLIGDFTLDGKFLQNKYWYRFDLYKKDIEGNIGIEKFNYLIYLLNITIAQYNYWKWHLNLFENEDFMDNQGNIIIKNENKIIIKHKEIKNDQDHYLKRYIKKYKNEKNIEIIKERLIIYSDFILNFKEFFLWLDKEKINFSLEIDHIFTKDCEHDMFYENIWINYEIDINNFKFKNKISDEIFNEKLKNLENIILNIEKDHSINQNLTDFYVLGDRFSSKHSFTNDDLFVNYFHFDNSFLNLISDLEKYEIESINVLNILEELKKIYKKDISIKKGVQIIPEYVLYYVYYYNI